MWPIIIEQNNICITINIQIYVSDYIQYINLFSISLASIFYSKHRKIIEETISGPKETSCT